MMCLRKSIVADGDEIMLKMTDTGTTHHQEHHTALAANSHYLHTIQDEALAVLADARLYLKTHVALVPQARKSDLVLRQSYEQMSKNVSMMEARYALARQMISTRSMLKRCVPSSNV
jgi:hypothetical protein